MARRIDLRPGALGEATFRYCCEGWEKRASAWATTLQRLGDPAAWNWTAVTPASGRLNRAIRRMAVSRIGSHPVLPCAARFIAAAGLQYEYGMGIHATASSGMRRQ